VEEEEDNQCEDEDKNITTGSLMKRCGNKPLGPITYGIE
jgi:hypothetical protein